MDCASNPELPFDKISWKVKNADSEFDKNIATLTIVLLPFPFFSQTRSVCLWPPTKCIPLPVRIKFFVETKIANCFH